MLELRNVGRLLIEFNSHAKKGYDFSSYVVNLLNVFNDYVEKKIAQKDESTATSAVLSLWVLGNAAAKQPDLILVEKAILKIESIKEQATNANLEDLSYFCEKTINEIKSIIPHK
jgi:hypothetical protein